MPAPGEGSPESGELGGWKALEILLDRYQVHEDEYRSHVENGGNQSSLHDVQIGQTGIFGDQECSGPHDRGQDLAPGACGRLDTPCLFGRVADLFHEGNGERPTGYDIGDGTPRHGSHRGGGQNSRLCGSSPLSSGDCIRQVHEELARARHLHERSEQDEDEDEGGGHTQRDPVYAFLAEIELSHEASRAVASMPKHAGECRTHIPVADETDCDERNGPAQRPSTRFEQRDDCHEPRKNVGAAPGSCPVHDGVQVEREIEGCEDGAGNEGGVHRPCHSTSGPRLSTTLDQRGATLHRKEEKGQYLDDRQMEAPLVEESERPDAGYVELKEREGDR